MPMMVRGSRGEIVPFSEERVPCSGEKLPCRIERVRSEGFIRSLVFFPSVDRRRPTVYTIQCIGDWSQQMSMYTRFWVDCDLKPLVRRLIVLG